MVWSEWAMRGSQGKSAWVGRRTGSLLVTGNVNIEVNTACSAAIGTVPCKLYHGAVNAEEH